jgi:ribosomal protein S6--L-glutamate ligase
MSNLHFLVLATGPQDNLIKAIESEGHTYELHNPNDLYLYISQSENGYDRLYNGHSSLLKPERLKAKAYDAVISRIGESLAHGASILRHVNENLGIYSTQDADGLQTASDKLKTTQKLSYRGLRVPKTIYAKNPLHCEFLLEKVDGLPAVAKLLQGSQGVGVNILETPRATNTMLQSFAKSKLDVKIQKFIDASGKDIRAIVIGDTVSVAMERTANKGEFRANLSMNGSGCKVELSPEDTDICIKAARAVGLEFAGVDIMKDKDGKTYVIEVNGNPGSKIIKVTGHDYFIDLVKHVVKKVRKRQEEQQEEKVKAELTDSQQMASTAQEQPKSYLARVRAKFSGSSLTEQEIQQKAKAMELKDKYPRLMDGIDV